MRKFLLIWIGAVFLAGCEGSIEADGWNDGNNVTNNNVDRNNLTNLPDLGESDDGSNNVVLDMSGNNTNDSGQNNQDPCQNVTCGANAMCDGGACACLTSFIGDPNAGCTPADPCATVTCSYGSTCSGGQCSCDAGFDDDGNGGCTQQTPGATASRTRQDVCGRWNSDFPNQAGTMWQVAPVDMCDPGVLHPDHQIDALRRTSLYRWLVGLPAVSSSASAVTMNQACATVLAAQNSGLTHDIPDTYACYTPLAAQGAASSNIALGVTNPAASVDLYVGDRNVRSLGHRRWVFNPSMTATGFGQRDRYSCMYAFDRGGSARPDYVAYPAPGFFPNQALSGYWSFGSTTFRFDANTTVTITKVSDGTPLAVSDVYVPGGGYGLPVIAWKVDGLELDVEYEIVIAGLSGAGTSVTYRTTIVSC